MDDEHNVEPIYNGISQARIYMAHTVKIIPVDTDTGKIKGNQDLNAGLRIFQKELDYLQIEYLVQNYCGH